MAISSEVQAVLQQVLGPESDVKREATQRLKVLYTDKSFVAALFNLLSDSSLPEVRHYAALLLRRKVRKTAQWSVLDPDVQKNLKENILVLLAGETENSVQISIAHLIGVIARHGLSSWPQLLQILEQGPPGAMSYDWQLNMLILKMVAVEAAKELQPYLPAVLALCARTLLDNEHRLTTLYSVQVLSNVVCLVTSSEEAQCSALIKQVHTYIKNMANDNEEVAEKAMVVFAELAECADSIVAPQVKPIIDFCLELAANSRGKDDPIRHRALSTINCFVMGKKKAIVELSLIEPIVDVIYSNICWHCYEQDDGPGAVFENPRHIAGYTASVMSNLARSLPSEMIWKHVMQHAVKGLQSIRPADRIAAYIALRQVAAGCSDYIIQSDMETFLQCGLHGLKDLDVTVRHSAMFALGELADSMPNQTKYIDEVLPCLQDYIRALSMSGKPDITWHRAFDMLDKIVHNLGEDIIPYVPTLMERQLDLHAMHEGLSEVNIDIKASSLHCIGAIVETGKSATAPYLLAVMEYIKTYLSQANGKLSHIQQQALDTLRILAREFSVESFAPLVNECIALGLRLLENCQDPDVRSDVYRLFGTLASLKTNETKGYVGKIATILIDSVKSTKGLQLMDEDEEVFDSFLDPENSEEVNFVGYRDAAEKKLILRQMDYMDEKEAAVDAIAELATHCSEAFVPFLEDSFEAVSAAFDISFFDVYTHEIQHSCAKALTRIACSLHDAVSNTSLPAGFRQQLNANLGALLKQLMPRLLMIVKQKEHCEVLTALASIRELLERIGQPVLHEGAHTVETLAGHVQDVFKWRTVCQLLDADDEAVITGGTDDGPKEDECDTRLINTAGCVLPPLAKITGLSFVPFLMELLPDLVKRMKPSCSDAQRSFSIRVVGDILHEMGEDPNSPFVSQLYPIFQQGTKDASDDVRCNAVYSLGVLAEHSGLGLQHKYDETAMALLSLLDKETNAYVKDNVCGALARLISRACMVPNPDSLVPLREIYPKMLRALPLKNDFRENETVYNCITGPLYRCARIHILDNLPLLLDVLTAVLPTDDLKTDTKDRLMIMLTDIRAEKRLVLKDAMTNVPLTSMLWKIFPEGL